MDAIAQGTREGVELLVNVTAMLIVAVALVALGNQLLALVATPFGISLSIEQMLGWVFAPLAWLIGIPWAECGKAGTLLGVKTVLNELIAYLQLGQIPASRAVGPLAPDPHLRAVRLRQCRQPRHPDRRHGGDGAAAARGDREPRRQDDRIGDAGDADDGGGRRRDDARMTLAAGVATGTAMG